MRTTSPFFGLLLLLCVAETASAQDSGVTGSVLAREQPVADAAVEAWTRNRLVGRARADERGRFRLTLEPGRYVLVFRALGYADAHTEIEVRPGDFALVQSELDPRPLPLPHVSVTALRQPRTGVDAPSSVTVIDSDRILRRTAVSAMDHALGSVGVDVAVQGLQSRQIVARGFNQTFGPFLLVMTDYRNASIPSLRGNLSQFIAPTADDMERIEIVRGPASALYGPNAADGVVHFITASPFDSPGTAASVTAGGRDLLYATARHAAIVGPRTALKVSGQYFRGDEWPAPPQPAELAQREMGVERFSGEARLDVRVSPRATAVLTLGSTLAMRHVEYTGLGASQIKNWRYDFAQARYTDGPLFVQTFLNRSDAGESFNLRSLDPVVDHSNVFAAQVQHGVELAGRSRLTYGVDYQRTDPRTAGTISGRNEDDDVSVEIGGYVQTDTDLSERLTLLLAGRVDHHSRLESAVISPRVGLSYSVRPGHTLRGSYNRAFSTPSSTDLFVDLLAARLDPLPFGLRALGVPQDGLRFARSSGGLCMTSPFAPGRQLPLDATLLWPAIVQILQGAGVDLSALPAPTGAEVRTVLRKLDLEIGAFRTHDGEIEDIEPLGPTITNSLELGYRGLFGANLLVDAAVYFTRRENFRGPLAVETPNAFLSTSDLTAYLGRFMPAAQASALAQQIGGVSGNPQLTGIPLATVGPDHAFAGSDILLTYRNVGEVEMWGGDLSLELRLDRRFSLGAAYSYISDNYFDEAFGATDLALNAPRHKGSLRLAAQDPERGHTAELRGRFVDSFRMVDGVWIGDVTGFGVLDLETGLQLPWSSTRLSFTVNNLLDNQHAEFVGAPVLGRHFMTRLQVRF